MTAAAACLGIAFAGVALLTAAPAVRFENVAAAAGLTRSIPNGGDTSKQFIIETTGSGVAFIDYDNDGLLDLFVASGPGSSSRLYHNEGAGSFKDVTEAMGLQQSGWAQGVCTGDYDNDGFTDLFVTYWGGNHLYRNLEGRRFEDVTVRTHLMQDRTRYNTGCAFLDYDNDGRLDLFVANYLKFDPKTTPKPGANPYCYYREIPVNCGPRGLPFDRNILYHANADGTFTDVSVESGIAAPDQNYSLGVLTGDFNNDGLVDIYVACDQTPSLLYINQGNGKFEEEGLLRGVAFDSNGKALSGMGATAADAGATGRLDIFRTNFSDERETLYRSLDAKGNFEDATIASGLAHNTRFVGWGCGFFDFDNDGWKDLLIVNGHVFPEVEKLKLDIHYKDRAILYRNRGDGKFDDISEASGAGILEQHSSRGAAFGDYDNDGRVEVLVNNQNEPPSLLKQVIANSNHWVLLKLTGNRSNRSAIGAKVRLTAGGRTQADEVRSGGSYLSQNDLRLHFGLGTAKRIDQVEIQWPSGVHQVEHDLAVDRVVSLSEPAASPRARVAERLAEAQLRYPAQPSKARRIFEESLAENPRRPLLTGLLIDVALDVDPDQAHKLIQQSGQPEQAYSGAIRHYMNRGDLQQASREAVHAATAGWIALDATQKLLRQLYSRRDPEGPALVSELLTFLPAQLEEREMRFLSENMRLLATIDPALSVQIAERILKDHPPPAYRSVAGAYLAVFNPIKFERLENLFEGCSDALRKTKRADLEGLAATKLPAFPDVPAPPSTPDVPAVRAELRAWSGKLLKLTPGDVSLVHFWADWCAPCRRERPVIEKLAARFKDRGFAVVGVNADTEPALQKEFEVAALPVALLVNREGDIVARLEGEQSEADFLRAIEPLLVP